VAGGVRRHQGPEDQAPERAHQVTPQEGFEGQIPIQDRPDPAHQEKAPVVLLRAKGCLEQGKGAVLTEHRLHRDQHHQGKVHKPQTPVAYPWPAPDSKGHQNEHREVERCDGKVQHEDGLGEKQAHCFLTPIGSSVSSR